MVDRLLHDYEYSCQDHFCNSSTACESRGSAGTAVNAWREYFQHLQQSRARFCGTEVGTAGVDFFLATVVTGGAPMVHRDRVVLRLLG